MNIKLSAQLREKGEKLPKELLPAVIYGSGSVNRSLKLNKVAFDKVYEEAGESALIDLEIDGQIVPVLVKDLAYDPIKNFITHVDFYQVDMNKKITTEIPLVFVGESKAVKDGGSLVKNKDVVEVECLPSALVPEIEVDLSVLKEIHDSIKVKDLNLPKGMEAMLEPEEVIAIVVEQEVEEETPIVPAAEAAAVPASEQKAEEKKD